MLSMIEIDAENLVALTDDTRVINKTFGGKPNGSSKAGAPR